MQLFEGMQSDESRADRADHATVPSSILENGGALQEIGRRQFIHSSVFFGSMLMANRAYSYSSGFHQADAQIENAFDYKTLEEWYLAPALTRKTDGAYAQLKQLSALIARVKTFSDKTKASEAMERLADTILSTVGNPVPYPLMAALRFPREHGLDLVCARMLTSVLHDNSENYPVRAMPGRVSAHMLLCEYIPQNTGLQFQVTDKAMEEELSRLQVDCSHALTEIIAMICNKTGMDMYTLPLVAEHVARAKNSVELRFCRQRPFAQLTYGCHQSEVVIQGRSVQTSGEEIHHRLGDDKTTIPERIIVVPTAVGVQQSGDNHICDDECCEVCCISQGRIDYVPPDTKEFNLRDVRTNTMLVRNGDGTFALQSADESVLSKATRNLAWSHFNDSLLIDHWAIRGAKTPLKFSGADAKRFRES